MAYCPRKARSELVLPTNFSAGRVSETTRRFQEASAASHNPARRPTRGSGLGATVVRWIAGTRPSAPPRAVEWAQAARDAGRRASESDERDDISASSMVAS